MIETTGDLWTFDPGGAFVWRGIPTNGVVKDNKLVMGAGVAKDAKEKFPNLPRLLGPMVEVSGNVPKWIRTDEVDYGLFTFPTKNHYNQDSDLNLIMKSATVVAAWALRYPEDDFILPRPGVGLGNLKWDDVKVPLLALLPDNVYIVSK